MNIVTPSFRPLIFHNLIQIYDVTSWGIFDNPRCLISASYILYRLVHVMVVQGVILKGMH